jgi:hypothetical protein
MCDQLVLVDYAEQTDAQCAAISGKKHFNEIYVRNVEHSHGWSSSGTYAHMLNSAVDAMTGRTNWSNENFRLMNVRTGKIGTAVIWRGPNRPGKTVGADEGHLRWNDGNCCGTSDWRPCDRLRLVDYNPKPETCPGTLAKHEFFVHNIEHNHGRSSAGVYAHFPYSMVDAIAGRTSWSNQDFRLRNMRTGKVGTAVIWRGPNRQKSKSTEAHLRWNDGNCCGANDWKMCDKLRLVDYEPTQADCAKISGALTKNQIYVTNIQHNHGRSSAGVYAHFPLAVVDAIAGTTTWHNQQFALKNVRTSKTGIAVIWRSPNRQLKDKNEGHLRWDDGNCCSSSDWQMCDRLELRYLNTLTPTSYPTSEPTAYPTASPTSEPTANPTANPTAYPPRSGCPVHVYAHTRI